MPQTLRCAVLVVLAVVSFLSLAPWHDAKAHGDAREIFRGREGNYDIIVGVQPEQPAVGVVHFSITPLDASTGLPATKARVRIVTNNPNGKPAFRARALNTPATPQYYDANITLDLPGVWTLTVDVESDDLGAAAVTVPFEVAAQGVTPSLSGGIVFVVLSAVLVAGGVYVWYSTSRRRRRALKLVRYVVQHQDPVFAMEYDPDGQSRKHVFPQV